MGKLNGLLKGTLIFKEKKSYTDSRAWSLGPVIVRRSLLKKSCVNEKFAVFCL